jgi:hypothetical protein
VADEHVQTNPSGLPLAIMALKEENDTLDFNTRMEAIAARASWARMAIHMKRSISPMRNTEFRRKHRRKAEKAWKEYIVCFEKFPRLYWPEVSGRVLRTVKRRRRLREASQQGPESRRKILDDTKVQRQPGFVLANSHQPLFSRTTQQ